MNPESILVKQLWKNEDNLELTKYKTLLRRIVSGIIDAAICMIPAIIVISVIYRTSLNGKYLFVVSLTNVVSIAYNIILNTKYSTTVGKSVMGLSIRKYDSNEKIVIGEALLRETINIFNTSAYLMFTAIYAITGRLADSDRIMTGKFNDDAWAIFGIISMVLAYSEMITAIFNKKRRALHDYIARTAVIRDSSIRMPIAILSTILGISIFILYFRLYALMKGNM